MNTDILILIGLATSIFVLVLMETHIAFMTFALCTGFVLTQFAGPDAYDLVSRWLSPVEYPVYKVVYLLLLLLPSLLVAHRFRRTQRGFSRFFEQIIPALAFMLLVGVFVVDILPEEQVRLWQEDSYLAGALQSYALMIIIFAIGTALFDILIKHANEPGHHGKKHRGPGRPPKHH